MVLQLFPTTSETRLVWTGRAWQLLMAACAVMLTPIMLQASSIYTFIQSILGAFNAPVGALFHCGAFHLKANSHGAAAALAVFVPLGLARFITGDLLRQQHGFAQLNFLYFTCVQFFGAYAVMMTVSLLTPEHAPELAQLDCITYWTQRRGGSEPMQLDQMAMIELSAVDGQASVADQQVEIQTDEMEGLSGCEEQPALGCCARCCGFCAHLVNLTGDYPWGWLAKGSLFSLMVAMTAMYGMFSGIFGIVS